MNQETENAAGQESEARTIISTDTGKCKTLPSNWKRVIFYVIAGVVILLLLKVGCSSGHIYEFDGGIINLSNVTTVRTGMRFQICYKNSGETAFSIGYAKDNTPINVPITKDNIAKIKTAIRENSKYHIFTVGGSAYIEFDGKSVHLQSVEEGWTWDGLERMVDSWFDETKAVFGKIK